MKTRIFKVVRCWAIALGTVLALSCQPGTDAPVPQYDHVVILGFDGFAGAALDSTDRMPFLKGMMERGAWTTHKRSILPTSSAANWASMVMGAGPEATGYTQWDSRVSVFTPAGKGPNGMFPTVFTQFREAFPEGESACFWQWDGIKYVVDTTAISTVRGFPDTEDGVDAMARDAARYFLEKKPGLTLLAWDYPDHTGHSLGWYTPDYYDMLGRLDKAIETVVKAIESSEAAGSTLIIVTTDHGGHAYGHGTEADCDLFGPLVICGPKVTVGELKDPVYQYDIAATVAAALRLPVPAFWRGTPVPFAGLLKE